MALVSRAFDSWRTSIEWITWGPLVRFSRRTVLAVLSRIEVGAVVVIDSDGTATHCGEAGESPKGPRAELRVVKDAFWVRALLLADMVRNSCLHRKNVVAGHCIGALRSVCLGLCREFHAGRDCVSESSSFLPGQCVPMLLKEKPYADEQTSGLYPQPHSTVQRHHGDLLNCFHPHRSGPDHEQSCQLATECLGTLRH